VTLALLILNCLLAVVVFVMFGALTEMYQQLKQVRDHLQMFDTPSSIELAGAEGRMPSEVGLPAELDTAADERVLFLSNRCETCFTLAQTLAGGVLPARLWLVVLPVSGDAKGFVEEFDLKGPRILVDDQEQIIQSLGLNMTPAMLFIKEGRLAEAKSVPTTRQMFMMLAPSDRSRPLLPLAKAGSHP
jgi:hypothetical protein